MMTLRHALARLDTAIAATPAGRHIDGLVHLLRGGRSSTAPRETAPALSLAPRAETGATTRPRNAAERRATTRRLP